MVEITNNSKALQGVQSSGRAVYVRPGTTKTVPLNAVELKMARRLKFLDIKGEAEAEPDNEGKQGGDAGSYEAREKSPGWFAVFDGEGKQVGSSIREDDANAFNALDAEAKAAKVAEMTKD